MQTSVLSIRRETLDTVTLRLATTFSFVPGQFIMLGIPIEGKEVKRSYSIASAPNGEWIEITIKKQLNGLVSTAVQSLRGGEELQLYGPFGRAFLFDPNALPLADSLVFIAGGSGIAPFRSFVQAVQSLQPTPRVQLLFSVRSAADLIYASELAHWPVQAHITLTRPSESELVEWKGLTGRIGPPHLRSLFGEKPEEVANASYFYICGPTPFVVDVQQLLARHGVAPERVKTEKYGLIDG